MMLMHEAPPELVDQEVSVVQGGPVDLDDIERRLSLSCERAEPRQRAMASRRGLLRPAERKNSWQLAEVSGDATPYGLQHQRRRALWDPEAVREELRHYLVPHLGDPEAVLVLDETGFLKKGRHAAGVARQDRGTAGKVENCQIGVFLGYASQRGHAWLDRERYLPQEQTTDRARCRQASISDERGFATKPQLAQHMLAQACGAGVPAKWVTGNRVYGDDRRLRMWLEGQPQADVLAVSGTAYVWLSWPQHRVHIILAALPEDGWTRRRAGDGTTGPRWDDWRWWPLAEPQEPGWRRWLLLRRRVSAPQELQADVVFALQQTALTAVVRVAGSCWTIESGVEAAKGAVGLDHDEVRSWTEWDSAYHPGHVGVGPADGAARGGHGGGGVQKTPAAPSRYGVRFHC